MSQDSSLSIEQLENRIREADNQLKVLNARRLEYLTKLGLQRPREEDQGQDKQEVACEAQDAVLVQPETKVRSNKLKGVLKLFETAVFGLFVRQRTENLLFHTVARFTAFPLLVGFMLIQTIAAGINLRREAQKENTKKRQLGWASFSFGGSVVTTGLAIASVALIFTGYLAVAPFLFVGALVAGTIMSAVYAVKHTWEWWTRRKDLIKECGGKVEYKKLEEAYKTHMNQYKELQNGLKQFKTQTFARWQEEFPLLVNPPRKRRFFESIKHYQNYLVGKVGGDNLADYLNNFVNVKKPFPRLRKQQKGEADFEYRVYLRETVGAKCADAYLNEFETRQTAIREHYFDFKVPAESDFTAQNLKDFAQCQYYGRKAAREWSNFGLGVIATTGVVSLMVLAPGVANVAIAGMTAGTGAAGVALTIAEHRDPDPAQEALDQKEFYDREIEVAKDRLKSLQSEYNRRKTIETRAASAAVVPAVETPAASAAVVPETQVEQDVRLRGRNALYDETVPAATAALSANRHSILKSSYSRDKDKKGNSNASSHQVTFQQ